MPVIEVPNKKGEYKNNPIVTINELHTDVKVVGNIATTTTTITLKNNSNRILEGRVIFPLPEGVSISGYALDINGKLREAVPVAKTKAKEVFESIEKRRVDPGLIEKVQGNNFRTRVYPINPNQTRKLQISYHQLLEDTAENYVYHLMTNSKEKLPHFHLKVTVFDQVVTPKLKESPHGSFTFLRNGNNWTAEIKKKNFLPSDNLTVYLPKKNNEIKAVFQPATNSSFYFLANVDLPHQNSLKKKPKSIALVWDNSLSGLGRNHQKELELLDLYLKWLGKVDVQVYELNNTFSKRKNFKIIKGNWDSLKSYLTHLSYDGGTDFETIEPVSEDEIILFSDGISSFGDLNKIWDKPVYTVVATPKANYQNLIKLAMNGGVMLNLNERSAKNLLSNLTTQNLQFLGIENNASVSDVVSSNVTITNNSITVTGIMSTQKTNITLKFGNNNKVAFKKVIALDANSSKTNHWDISKFWAQYKIADLERQVGNYDEEIENIAKQFSIVTNNTSLMVLENVQDYVRYQIPPPSELTEEYNRIRKEDGQRLVENRKNRMRRAEDMMGELKAWWSKDFKPKKVYPKTDTVPINQDGYVLEEAAEINSYNDSASEREAKEVRSESSSSNAMVASNKMMKIDKPSGKVTIIDVKSDKEYMKLFDGKNSNEIYAQYLENRPHYFSTPSYYFDVAQLLWNDRADLALKVISSIADLGLEDEELYKLLAYQLKNKKVYGKELWVTKKILEWRPFDPQSYRDYALALEDNGKYQEALENLYKVITNTYTEEIASRDTGIEEVILMEINQLISRRKSYLNSSDINPKLIADLPVQIRVVMNWNKDNTDIDLWVTDPNGEACSYKNKETNIGGRLSEDFRGGFGPEQFLLKKAIKGKYKIETNFFAENQVSVSGPTAIMAEVYIDYASGNQERKTIVFQSEKKKGGERNQNKVFIAEFEF